MYLCIAQAKAYQGVLHGQGPSSHADMTEYVWFVVPKGAHTVYKGILLKEQPLLHLLVQLKAEFFDCQKAHKIMTKKYDNKKCREKL